jgi:transposase
VRRPLPDHLPREEIIHAPNEVCPACGGKHFSKLGEDTTEVLEKIPARLKVIRHIRPKLSCRTCETIIQAPGPDLPIEKGRPGAGLIANVVVSKYLDGLPLYRQSAILAREGIEIERATLADWIGHAAWWLAPLAQFIGAYVVAAPVIHTDDTPIKVLAPGNGKTRTGRIWIYLVDERPWQGSRAPAAYYRYSPDRKGERPRDHLATFHGVIQADAFSGYEALTRQVGPPGANAPRIMHAACWAHYLESEFMLSIASRYQYWPMPTGCRTRHKSRLHGTMRRRERKCPCRSRFRYRPAPRYISRARAGAVSNCPAARYILPVAAHLPAMAAMGG